MCELDNWADKTAMIVKEVLYRSPPRAETRRNVKEKCHDQTVRVLEKLVARDTYRAWFEA